MISVHTRKHLLFLLIGIALVGGYAYLSYYHTLFPVASPSQDQATSLVDQALAAKFDALSKNGNSTCSATFQDAVRSGATGKERLQGSCCSPMDLHRYTEQVQGLKKYSGIAKIPSDPYDIDAALAKEMAGYYDLQLTPEEQKAYDEAMANSKEKGPCCCKCWRWYVYGGLGKYLIRNEGFTGEQVTEIWNLSDGCGGPGEHVQHMM